MSQENVELVREAWRVFSEQGIEAVIGYYAQGCSVEALPQAPDRETRKGWDGLRERNRTFSEPLGDLDWKPVEFIDAADNVVVAVLAMRGRGESSGVPIDARIAFVYELREGKIVRDRPFTSRSEALEAAGLRE